MKLSFAVLYITPVGRYMNDSMGNEKRSNGLDNQHEHLVQKLKQYNR